MIIGVLTVELFLGEANSLKDKRRILKSMLDRVKARFNVSVAEVGEQNVWRRSTIGISFVSCEPTRVHQVFAAIIRFINAQGTMRIVDYETELL